MTAAIRHSSPFDGFKVEPKAPLARHTSFRVGGPADYLAAPQSTQELRNLLKAAQAAGIPITFLGGGTNVLISDNGVCGLVILMTGLKGMDSVTPSGRLRVLAGQPLASVCRHAVEKGLSGLEWAAGIPGTLGGAVMMNAGSFGSDMAAIIHKIEILDLNSLTVAPIDKTDLVFSYRNLELGKALILGAELNLAAIDPDTVKKAHAANLKVKKNTQPVSQASAGCFFKNPSPEKPAGWLIEKAGLKGYTHKGARVSEIHANFIVNQGQATTGEILDLAQRVTDRVKKAFNITLEKEVKQIGR